MNDTKPGSSISTAVVLFTIRDSLELLLVQGMPERLPTAPLVPGERLEACARRALGEATGIEDVFLEQLYTFGVPATPPEVIVAYYALVPVWRVNVRKPGVGWADPARLPALMADHQRIVRCASERLAAKLDYAPIAYQFLDEQFTLSELQSVYEIIGRQPLDKRNFRRRIQASSCLIETKETRRNGRHRPAKLYRLRPTSPPDQGQEFLT